MATEIKTTTPGPLAELIAAAIERDRDERIDKRRRAIEEERTRRIRACNQLAIMLQDAIGAELYDALHADPYHHGRTGVFTHEDARPWIEIDDANGGRAILLWASSTYSPAGWTLIATNPQRTIIQLHEGDQATQLLLALHAIAQATALPPGDAHADPDWVYRQINLDADRMTEDDITISGLPDTPPDAHLDEANEPDPCPF